MNTKFRSSISALGIRLSIIGVLSCCGAIAQACNVPVFRYALERWRPDPYRIALLHNAPLNDQDRALVSSLEAQQEKSAANVLVRQIDVSGLERDKSQDVKLQAPQLVVSYPEHLRIETPVWKGLISKETVDELTDSPARKELVKRLIDGQTAVWLLLESGQSEKDEAAAKLVEGELKRLEQDLKLPELTASPDDAILSSTPLRIQFSLLRVPRNDRAEHVLVEMLLRSESDLAERSDPLVFPVFGRGRALFPLVGAGITKENIQDAATFLVGPCSCQVKEDNPGFDLLLAADWDSLLSLEGIELTAVASQDQAPPKGEVELVPIPSGSKSAKPAPVAAASENHQSHPPTGQLNTAGVVLVTLLAITAVIVAGLLVLRR